MEKDIYREVVNVSGETDSAVYLWNGKFLFFRKSISSSQHCHHAIQICLGLEQPIKVINDKKEYVENRVVLIDSGYPHTVVAPEAKNLFLFLEPELHISRQIREIYFRDGKIRALDISSINPHAGNLLSRFARPVTCDVAGNIVDDVVSSLGCSNRPVANQDTRIRKILDLLANPARKYSSKELAAESGLSESRMQHLFKEQVGIPIRQYLLWRRLILAIGQIARMDRENPLTDAAIYAGFADSAHFSRTFKRMFGITPSEILQSRRPGRSFALYICD